MPKLSPSSERDVRAVLKSIDLDTDVPSPERDSLWKSTWVAILMIRLRCVIDSRKSERCQKVRGGVT